MDPLPDKPAGCEIADAADADGVTLSWPAYKAAGAGCLGFWLGGRATARTHTPEFVRLSADALRYDPGSGPTELRSCAELPSGKVVPVTPAPATEVPKAAIRRFGVDHVNERQRLYFDQDDRRVEIGGCLTESERAWLFEVLQRWLGAPRRAPPWARDARGSKEEAQA